jgi:hypothetical protein
MRTRGAYLAWQRLAWVAPNLTEALIADFLRLGPLRLDFLDKRSQGTVAPPMELRRNGFATDVAAHLTSRAKFRTFTSRAIWRAPF